MYIVIVGAGKIAQELTAICLKNNCRVAVVEKESEEAEKMIKKFNQISVFNADIAQKGILDEIDAEKADVLIATTNDDSVNLMTMYLGKQWKIDCLIAMLNNDEHQEMFNQLGVRILTNPQEIIANKLFSFIEQD